MFAISVRHQGNRKSTIDVPVMAVGSPIYPKCCKLLLENRIFEAITDYLSCCEYLIVTFKIDVRFPWIRTLGLSHLKLGFACFSCIHRLFR